MLRVAADDDFAVGVVGAEAPREVDDVLDGAVEACEGRGAEFDVWVPQEAAAEVQDFVGFAHCWGLLWCGFELVL